MCLELPWKREIWHKLRVVYKEILLLAGLKSKLITEEGNLSGISFISHFVWKDLSTILSGSVFMHNFLPS